MEPNTMRSSFSVDDIHYYAERSPLWLEEEESHTIHRHGYTISSSRHLLEDSPYLLEHFSHNIRCIYRRGNYFTLWLGHWLSWLHSSACTLKITTDRSQYTCIALGCWFFHLFIRSPKADEKCYIFSQCFLVFIC